MTSTLPPSEAGPASTANHNEPDMDPEDTKSVVSSDGEGQKVREKLKKTSLAAVKGGEGNTDKDSEARDSGAEDSPTDESMVSSPTSASVPRSRKRSRDLDESEDAEEDLTEEVIDENGQKIRRPVHRRKRSRDRDMEVENGDSDKKKPSRPATPQRSGKTESDEELPDAKITSPRTIVKKRAREDLEKEEEDAESVEAGSIAQDNKDEPEKGTASRPMSRNFTDEHAKKRLRESPESEEKKSESPKIEEKKAETKLPPGSGFANTSASSPFATAGASGKPIFGSGAAKSLQAKDLFAQSKFGALSSSSASPFASVGSGASPFAKAGVPPSPFATSGGAPSPFASVGNKNSIFGGAAKSLFGKTDSTKPLAISKKPAKPFGAPDTDDEDEDEDGSGDENNGNDDDKDKDKEKEKEKEKKEKFVEQEVSTGEEDEETVFQFRGKIFVFDKETKSWKERGMGNIRLKSSIPDANDLGSDDKPQRRIRVIARADATYRVVLNILLNKNLLNLYGDRGKEPSGTAYNLVGYEDETTKQFIIKTKHAKELHEHILACLN